MPGVVVRRGKKPKRDPCQVDGCSNAIHGTRFCIEHHEDGCWYLKRWIRPPVIGRVAHVPCNCVIESPVEQWQRERDMEIASVEIPMQTIEIPGMKVSDYVLVMIAAVPEKEM